ncbi:PDZ and LIM domain protein 2-like [Osmerus mordax]|uniref:PDZ and LIM domain protein 2-like n=1 Tax=Osmerus mordax TaxID=8014 RepID=UPI00351002D0
MMSLVTLTGPPPWGFRLSGGLDFRRVLSISKVNVYSKAELASLRVGDVIVEINGESAARMLHVQAYDIIKNSRTLLTLLIERPHAAIFRQPQCVAVPPQNPACQKQMFAQKVSEVSRDGLTNTGSAQCSHTVMKQRVLPAVNSPGRKPVKTEGQHDNTQSCDAPRQTSPLLTLEVFKGSRLRDTAPRQSNTFNLIQEVLEQDYRKSGPRTQDKTPSSALPPSNLPFFRVRPFRSCESCGTRIVTQAIKISEGRYRHQECYTCQDCGLTLLKRGHFWVGEHLYCGKHASQRCQSPR